MGRLAVARALSGAALLSVFMPACSSREDSISGPPQPPPPASQPAVRIEIVPGALLLTGSGASQKLSVRAYDAQGQPTTATVTWRSSTTAITVTSDGTATATVATGSATITAETANGVASVPIVAIVARPVTGALLVSDAQVVGGLTEVDPASQFGPGWRYQVVLTNTAAPAPGTILLASGGAVVAGKVISVVPSGSNIAVTLELLPLRELFDDLKLDIELPFVPVEAGSGTASAARMPAPRPVAPRRDNGPEFPIEFEMQVGPFACKVTGSAPDLSVQNVSRTLQVGNLSAELGFSFETGITLVARGAITGELTARPTVGAGAWTGRAKCELNVPNRPWTLPLGGFLALFYGLQLQPGVGFALDAKLETGEVALDIVAKGTANVRLGFICPSGGSCQWVNEFVPNADGSSVRPILPELNEARVMLDGRGYVFLKLQMGPSLFLLAAASTVDADKLTLKLAEASVGIKQSVDVTSARRQAADPQYSSSFDLKLDYEVKPDIEVKLGVEELGKRMGWVLQIFEDPLFADSVFIAHSPRGGFSVTPSVATAGNDQQLGDLVTFRFDLDPITYLGSYSVDRVEILWMKPSGTTMTLENGRPPCTTLAPTSSGQAQFTCQVDFLEAHIGTQTFVGFVYPKLFGVPLPVPLEVAADTRRTVEVTVECPPSAQPSTSVSASPEICEEPAEGLPIIYTFDSDLQGWGTGNNDRIEGWGTAEWREFCGSDRPKGCVKLDGVGGEGLANAWIFKSIALPAGTTKLEFEHTAHNRKEADSFYRVRLIDEDGAEHVLVDWTVTAGEESSVYLWEKVTLDISQFAGQEVVLYFEGADNGPGFHEQRYYDNITIR